MNASVTYTLVTHVENLVLTGTANINGTGNDWRERPSPATTATTGSRAADNDTLDGGLGNDFLDGDAGDDKLLGGKGDDTYIIDLTDTVTEGTGEGTDTIQIDASDLLGRTSRI